MRSATFRIASLTFVCALAVSCSDGTAPSASDAAVTQLLSDVGTAQSFGAVGSQLPASVSSAYTRTDAESCSFNGTTQMYVCAPRTIAGLTVSRSFQLLDASDASQQSYSPTTTAAIRVITDVTGVFNTTTTSSSGTTTSTTTLIAHEDSKLSGLLTGTHTLNSTGNANAQISSSVGPTLTLATTQAVTNLVLPKHGESQYPKSGTIASTIAASLAGLPSLNTELSLTFDGTQFATLVITSSGHTQTCTVDMSKRGSLPVCSAP